MRFYHSCCVFLLLCRGGAWKGWWSASLDQWTLRGNCSDTNHPSSTGLPSSNIGYCAGVRHVLAHSLVCTCKSHCKNSGSWPECRLDRMLTAENGSVCGQNADPSPWWSYPDPNIAELSYVVWTCVWGFIPEKSRVKDWSGVGIRCWSGSQRSLNSDPMWP